METADPHRVQHHVPGASSQPSSGPDELPGIRYMTAVGSGKGRVGKSTVSMNLALALQQIGGRIGLVDTDIYGPSIPSMLGLASGQRPATTADRRGASMKTPKQRTPCLNPTAAAESAYRTSDKNYWPALG